jgi:hypothetical protein
MALQSLDGRIFLGFLRWQLFWAVRNLNFAGPTWTSFLIVVKSKSILRMSTEKTLLWPLPYR